MSKFYSIKEIVEHAKENSPYYQNLYKSTTSLRLEDLPVINQEEFWKSEVVKKDDVSGIVFKSGGSSGAPKYSYFTHTEWINFTSVFGSGLTSSILETGDRVGNLFYAGDLYASFLFIKDSLQWIDTNKKKITQFPVVGSTSPDKILKTVEEFNLNVLAGVPSQILVLLDYYQANKKDYKNVNLEKIFYGGEGLYPDQEKTIQNIFPGIKLSSVGCASVDGGMLGFASPDCQNGEHRVFDGASIIEIVDPETFEVIHEKNRIGKVLLTNLTRKLMPIIRYPAGDMAMWLEDAGVPNRKFILQGRSDEAARLGTLSVYFEDTRDFILKCLGASTGIQFQMVLKHYDHKDELCFLISGVDVLAGEKIEQAFTHEKPVYKELLAKKLIHPLKIAIVDHNKLYRNERTGKLKRIIDERLK